MSPFQLEEGAVVGLSADDHIDSTQPSLDAFRLPGSELQRLLAPVNVCDSRLGQGLFEGGLEMIYLADVPQSMDGDVSFELPSRLHERRFDCGVQGRHEGIQPDRLRFRSCDSKCSLLRLAGSLA